ncbi:transcriptional attenuator, LytR family [Pilibacter termitis]|uniref:Transcriptional attenuator, LytR family n=1 Tax=Pilibacter termitis TaxID=263852 RepID=A0A1T4PCD0_9ENTE|nr:LCP family protein [Pilibacter termitis]SJZ88997.1 transcriptional attenuator, LytR family [Pilibacter termitis]
MTLTKKITLVILGILAIGSITVTALGMKMYQSAETKFGTTYQPLKNKKKKTEDAVQATKPFSVLLMGIDTGDKGRIDQGRSDSMMVVTVNPVKKQTTILSLDRDILTHLVDVGENSPNPDKMNHSYAYGGAEGTMATVSTLLDIEIDYYAAVNMKGLSDLVDAVGGLEIDNKFDASEVYPNEYPAEVPTEEEGRGFVVDDGASGRTFVPYGKHHLNGEKALAYSRMRHQDPEGDIGRQKRQREVVQLLVKKMMSFDSLGKYEKIFDAVSKNMKTDLSFNQLTTIAESYRSAMDTVKNMQLEGIDYNIPQGYYQLLPSSTLLEAQNYLKEQLDLPTKEELTDPEATTYESFTGQQSQTKVDLFSGAEVANVNGATTSEASGYADSSNTTQGQVVTDQTENATTENVTTESYATYGEENVVDEVVE